MKKAPPGPARMPGKAKPKAKGKSRASKPRQSVSMPKSPPIEGAVLAGMRSRERATGKPASRLIGQQARDVGDSREEALARMRALILEADPRLLSESTTMRSRSPKETTPRPIMESVITMRDFVRLRSEITATRSQLLF